MQQCLRCLHRPLVPPSLALLQIEAPLFGWRCDTARGRCAERGGFERERQRADRCTSRIRRSPLEPQLSLGRQLLQLPLVVRKLLSAHCGHAAKVRLRSLFSLGAAAILCKFVSCTRPGVLRDVSCCHCFACGSCRPSAQTKRRVCPSAARAPPGLDLPGRHHRLSRPALLWADLMFALSGVRSERARRRLMRHQRPEARQH